MSDVVYDEILGGLESSSGENITASQAGNHNQQQNATSNEPGTVCTMPSAPAAKIFDVQDFIDELAYNSEKKNKSYRQHASMINSYDVAHNCIREIIFKILNYPVESYRDVWLPIILRACLGNAVHDFIQGNCSTFTEQEMSVKVPSIRCSTRMDCLIGNNVLVEIKSCTYSDYYKILKSMRPRDPDFYQTLFYKYLLENHLQEAQQQQNTRTPPPQQESYNIETIQLIYVAHDVMATDCKSFSECQKVAKEVKQMLQSRQNQFHFITSVNIDLNAIDVQPHMDWLINKVNQINYYLDNQTVPPMNDPFVNSKGCHFCLYKKLCGQYGGGR